MFQFVLQLSLPGYTKITPAYSTESPCSTAGPQRSAPYPPENASRSRSGAAGPSECRGLVGRFYPADKAHGRAALRHQQGLDPRAIRDIADHREGVDRRVLGLQPS